MKFYKSKTAKFLAGKGFYVVLAVCMAAMGIAVYSALDAVDMTEQQENSSTSENQQSIVVPSVPVEEQEPVSSQPQQNENEEEDTRPVDTEGVATFFMLPINGEVIKHYDAEHLQYSATYNDMRLHTGTDLKPTSGNEVVAAGDGTVTAVEENTVLGNVITIDHGNGVSIRYCGIKNIAVTVSQAVFAGDILGEVGTVTNECSDEEHIHMEVFKDGKAVNPADFFGIK